MRHLCCSKILFLLLLTLTLFAANTPRVAFYYGSDLSGEFLERFDWVVVDPDVTDPVWVKRYPDKLFAYVSISEYEKWRHHKDSNTTRTLGKNPHWHTLVMDPREPQYREFLLEYMQALARRGYRNFFLDTLDSPFGKIHDREQIKALKSALSSLIITIRSRFKDAKLIANRGVEVMDTLCESVDAFAIESLYHGIDPQTKAYVDLSGPDRNWVKTQLQRAKRCGLVPVVIDYLPEEQISRRIKTAAQIASEGYVPYITDRFLQHEGIGAEIPQKRRVLLLYDSRLLKDGDKVYSDSHLLASMPLEYLGYIPVLQDIRKGLPDAGTDRYSAVILWPASLQTDEQKLFLWVKKHIHMGQKIIFINDFGFTMTPKRANVLGLEYQTSRSNSRLLAKVLHKAPLYHSEFPPLVNIPEALINPQKGKPLLVAQNQQGQKFTPAAIMPWGGYAVCESAVREFEKEPLWSLDPFAFFAAAIADAPFPVPDPTTENGRRLLFIHIDGDGFVEKAHFQPDRYAPQILYDEILSRYRVPHSVSVITGEIAPTGAYANLAARLMPIARKIFALDYVEAASHSYSHPFIWQDMPRHSDKAAPAQGYHLKLPGYRFSLSREINTSIAFINQHLLPVQKKCKLFFWTGNCLPSADALRLCENMGIASINGGDTTATKKSPWLSRIAPFGIQRGHFWQVYVGAQNENVYTNNWQGPFWGYRRVLQTFAITDRPKRLKPIDIYYHFYSASKTASLRALRQVYDYAIHADTLPLYTSQYIAIVQDFYTTAITRMPDGGWHVQNHGNLRTLRVPGAMGYPDIKRSSGVAGFKKCAEGGYYLHLDGSGSYRLYFQSEPPKVPYLIEANARIEKWIPDAGAYRMRLQGYQPLYARFHIPPHWKLIAPSSATVQQAADTSIMLTSAKNSIEVTIVPR